MKKRTSEFTVFVRVFLTCWLPMVFFCMAFGGWSLFFYGWTGAILICWFVTRFITNTVVKMNYPDEYYALKADGGSHFAASFGWPFNNDSTETIIGTAEFRHRENNYRLEPPVQQEYYEEEFEDFEEDQPMNYGQSWTGNNFTVGEE